MGECNQKLKKWNKTVKSLGIKTENAGTKHARDTSLFQHDIQTFEDTGHI